MRRDHKAILTSATPESVVGFDRVLSQPHDYAIASGKRPFDGNLNDVWLLNIREHLAKPTVWRSICSEAWAAAITIINDEAIALVQVFDAPIREMSVFS